MRVIDLLTLAKVGDVVIPIPEFDGGLWARLSSWQSFSRSSDRLIGRTRGGGPKCHFCCWSFSYDSRAARVLRTALFVGLLPHDIMEIKRNFTCRALILPWTFSWDKILEGSTSVRTCSSKKMLSRDKARDPIILWEDLLQRGVRIHESIKVKIKAGPQL